MSQTKVIVGPAAISGWLVGGGELCISCSSPKASFFCLHFRLGGNEFYILLVPLYSSGSQLVCNLLYSKWRLLLVHRISRIGLSRNSLCRCGGFLSICLFCRVSVLSQKGWLLTSVISLIFLFYFVSHESGRDTCYALFFLWPFSFIF